MAGVQGSLCNGGVFPGALLALGRVVAHPCTSSVISESSGIPEDADVPGMGSRERRELPQGQALVCFGSPWAWLEQRLLREDWAVPG